MAAPALFQICLSLSINFFDFHVPKTPIGLENLFNERKKQYFRRPYRLVIIYYRIDNEPVHL